MGKRLLQIIAAMLVCLTLMPSVGYAKRYNVVRQPDGTVKVVDPTDNVITRIIRLPYSIIRVVFRPATGKPAGFGRTIRQKDMEADVTIQQKANSVVDGATNAATNVATVTKNTATGVVNNGLRRTGVTRRSPR